MLKKQGMCSFEVFSLGIVPVSLRQVQAAFLSRRHFLTSRARFAYNRRSLRGRNSVVECDLAKVRVVLESFKIQ